jgi:hypothetical protein
VIGTRNRRQWSQAPIALTAAPPENQSEGLAIILEILRPDGEHRGKHGKGHHSTDEGEQQDDAGQCHAPLAREEFGQPPRRPCNQQSRNGGGAFALDPRPDIVADPGHGDEQDDRRDRDEDVVESGQQPEMFLVDDRHMAPGRDEIPEACGLLGGQRPAGDRSFQIAFAIHEFLLPGERSIARVI